MGKSLFAILKKSSGKTSQKGGGCDRSKGGTKSILMPMILECDVMDRLQCNGHTVMVIFVLHLFLHKKMFFSYSVYSCIFCIFSHILH